MTPGALQTLLDYAETAAEQAWRRGLDPDALRTARLLGWLVDADNQRTLAVEAMAFAAGQGAPITGAEPCGQ